MITVCSSASLRLKDAGPCDANLLDEIESVNDGRILLGVKHASKGFLGVANFGESSLPEVSGPKTLLQVRALSPC
jgi:hypothetical protein